MRKKFQAQFLERNYFHLRVNQDARKYRIILIEEMLRREEEKVLNKIFLELMKKKRHWALYQEYSKNFETLFSSCLIE